MPWSDVRRISHVCAGGMAIHMTEAVNSANARRNNRNRSSDAGTTLFCEGSDRGIEDSNDGDNGPGGGSRQNEAWKNSGGEGQEEGGKDDSDEGTVESLSRMAMETEDAWTQGDRRTSMTHATASGSAKWDRDGYEWERVAQASLEYVLGQEFASKYKVMTSVAESSRVESSLIVPRRVTFLVWPVS